MSEVLGRAGLAALRHPRARSGEELLRVFLRPEWCIEDEPGDRERYAGLWSFLGLDDLFRGSSEPGPEPHR